MNNKKEPNRLSYSASKTYSECGHKYFLRYKQGLRSKNMHAALLFGSAIDNALNELLLTKDLHKAKSVFAKMWAFQEVNGKLTELYNNPLIVYAETDSDKELLFEEDWKKLENYLPNTKLDFTLHSSELFQEILKEKKTKGWENLRQDKREFYNYFNWLCMTRKGYIMLEGYNKRILPKIKNVLAVQHKNEIKNDDGDSIIQFIDLIVEWKDGRRLLGDNKTSAREYEENSAANSPQLISYYFGLKDEFKLDGVCFFVLRKNILKNRVKICSKCAFDGTGGRHKTCDNELDGKRCGAAWNETISPEADIQIIINEVSPHAEQLVMESFDAANEGIKKEQFHKNLSACKQGVVVCDYFQKCWHGNDSGLVQKQSDGSFKEVK